MESSPLVLAHEHARNASVATHSSDTTVAINEHALAAGEFAKAATGTASAEALRTLHLLEHHHQRLSELLRFPAENPPVIKVQATEKPLSTSAAVAELRASKSDLGARPSSPLRNLPGRNHPRKLPPRDLSSSIASNLASARGIRTNYTRQPLSPSVSTQQAPGSLEALPRRDKWASNNISPSIPEHSRPSWIPPTQPRRSELPVSTSTAAEPEPSALHNDEGFFKFYSTFENILHKLSAPLAFAGLPLGNEEGAKPPQPETGNTKRPKKDERTGSDPDLTKFISRAALRVSTREGHSANDSFYVVPTTGHTVSYAHILSFAEKEKRRLANSMHSENPDLFADPEEDDFVDARETPMPVSPTASRSRRPISPSSSRGGKRLIGKELEVKVEELGIENQSLKGVVDKLSKRLHAFEMAAQNSSMALQESMRLMRDMSPASLSRESSGAGNPVPSSVGGDEVLKRRVLELEEHVQLGRKEIEGLRRENEKLRTVVARYRDRWEKLKEGAKTRRDGGNGKEGPFKKDDVLGGA